MVDGPFEIERLTLQACCSTGLLGDLGYLGVA